MNENETNVSVEYFLEGLAGRNSTRWDRIGENDSLDRIDAEFKFYAATINAPGWNWAAVRIVKAATTREILKKS
tara:strand:+ start:530 stop:751 length:222 start_codon:yes stop_codon:yes gene_type:complete